MNNYDLIGKTIRINDRYAKIEDINGNKVTLTDEYGIEFQENLKKINTISPVKIKELYSIKFNSKMDIMVFYYEDDKLKFKNCRSDDWEELKEFLDMEDIKYSGDIKSYLDNTEDNIDINNVKLTEENIEALKNAIRKLGYVFVDSDMDDKLTLNFKSKNELDPSLSTQSQIQKHSYDEFNRIDDLLMDLEDMYQSPILFDLELDNTGKYRLSISVECR